VPHADKCLMLARLHQHWAADSQQASACIGMQHRPGQYCMPMTAFISSADTAPCVTIHGQQKAF
jgi:hypothetical protein